MGATEETESAAGQTLAGRYRLVHPLGSGGMATVWRAYDPVLDVQRAIKILDLAMAKRPKIKQRFDNEARTMAKLVHPNIVTVHDVGIDGDRPYIVMELLEGGSAMGWVETHGKMPPRMASSLVQAMLAGLAAAHNRGVVHRDVKPHNVLLTADGTPKVTDFGIAQVREGAASMTRTGMVMGTWAYMAPEQKQSAKDVDARSDVYAAAATLYALVSGNEPFDLYASEVQEEVSERLPPALVDVVRRGTRFRPEDRWPSALAMLDALRAIQGELPPDPPETPPLGGHHLPPMDPAFQGVEGTIDLDAAEEPPPTEKGAPVRTMRTRSDPDTAPGPTNVEPTGERTVESAKSEPPPQAPASRGPIAVVAIGAVLALCSVGAWFAWPSAAELQPAAAVIEAPASIAPTPAPTPGPVPEPVPVPVPVPEPESDPATKPVVAASAASDGGGRDAHRYEKEPEVAAPVVVVEATPEPPAPPVTVAKVGKGRLFVNSIPWSYVTVDGQGEARTGWSGDLSEGEHTLKFRTEAGVERTKKVVVTAPETRFCWKLVEDVPC